MCQVFKAAFGEDGKTRGKASGRAGEKGIVTKYHAVRTEIDGYIFASKAEARRYSELSIAEKNGDIQSLELQPKFPVVVNEKKICTYIADFRYVDRGVTVIEDVKGVKTPVYKLKKRLVEALYDVEIIEIK